MDHTHTAIGREELEGQHTAELPRRELLASIILFGIPLAGVSDVAVNVDTSGPGWFIAG
jgi:hypothetical protein